METKLSVPADLCFLNHALLILSASPKGSDKSYKRKQIISNVACIYISAAAKRGFYICKIQKPISRIRISPFCQERGMSFRHIQKKNPVECDPPRQHDTGILVNQAIFPCNRNITIRVASLWAETHLGKPNNSFDLTGPG